MDIRLPEEPIWHPRRDPPHVHCHEKARISDRKEDAIAQCK